MKVKAYHGSTHPIRKFDPKFSAMGVFWFSENKDEILRGESGAVSAKYLIEVVLDVKNPANRDQYERFGLGELKGQGHDCVHLEDCDNWIIFESKSIKVVNVTENKTPFIKQVKAQYHVTKSGTFTLAAAPISGSELLDIYYDMTPNDQGADRVERVLHEISGGWELTSVPLADITWMDSWITNKKLVNKYAAQTTKAPPIILDYVDGNYSIIDGFHRIAAAKKRGETHIQAYIPTGEDA